MVRQLGNAQGSSRDAELGVYGPVAVPDLTGRRAPDELGLTLGDSPAYIARESSGDGSSRYIVVLGQPLGRRALMDLLYTLAPYKAHGPDRFARVLDNWGIHDRAAANPTSNGLFQQHVRSLKLSWQVFSEHRRVFMSVLEDQSEQTRVVPVITWDKLTDGTRRWRFDDLEPQLLQRLDGTVPVLQAEPGVRQVVDAVTGLVCLPYFLPELHKGWPAWQPLVKNGKSNYVGPASVPMMALMHRRAILNSRFASAAEELAT